MYSGWELEAGYFAKHGEPFSDLLKWLESGGCEVAHFVRFVYENFEDYFDMRVAY